MHVMNGDDLSRRGVVLYNICRMLTRSGAWSNFVLGGCTVLCYVVFVTCPLIATVARSVILLYSYAGLRVQKPEAIPVTQQELEHVRLTLKRTVCVARLTLQILGISHVQVKVREGKSVG
jgi:hypothetical protein